MDNDNDDDDNDDGDAGLDSLRLVCGIIMICDPLCVCMCFFFFFFFFFYVYIHELIMKNAMMKKKKR